MRLPTLSFGRNSVRDGLERLAAADWAGAVDELERALANGSRERSAWMAMGSALERLGDATSSTGYVTVGNRLAPSAAYDSAAAFAVYAKAPYERDRMAEYLVAHDRDLVRHATDRINRAAGGERTAFVYWDTEERPPLVQLCIESMRRHLPKDIRLVELNGENLGDWISLDDRVRDAVARQSNLSDVIRTQLLTEHGGVWLDATVMLRDGCEADFDMMLRQDLFMFTYAGSRTGSWVMAAKPRSYRAQLIRASLESWLLETGEWTNYFMFHDIVEMLYWSNPRYRQHWNEGAKVHPRAALALHGMLARSVSDEEWSTAVRASPIHKLNWKITPRDLDDPTTGLARVLAGQVENVDTAPASG